MGFNRPIEVNALPHNSIDICLLFTYTLYINLFALHYIPVLLGCEINSTN